jgi:hypothetical protein
MDQWTTKRILILGTTYPSYSKKYVENACTGGLEEGTGNMVRIHPVPLRYLETRFKNFQWITARTMKHPSDPRPESLRIEPNSIELGDVIPSTRADERRQLIESSPRLFQSVEALKDRWEANGTSLGTIRPKKINNIRIVMKSDAERAEWLAKEKDLFSQQSFEFERPPKPIDFPEAKFCIAWTCDDSRCNDVELRSDGFV